MCICVRVPTDTTEGIGSPGVEVTDGLELHNMGARN